VVGAAAVADVVAITVAAALTAQRNIFGLINSGSVGESIIGEVADRSLVLLILDSPPKYSTEIFCLTAKRKHMAVFAALLRFVEINVI
jgi:hypothetical protein